MKVIIIDDEPKGRAVLKKMLEMIDTLTEIIGEADSVTSGFQLLSSKTPDLLFLDIRMEDGTGFMLLDKLQHIPFKVIFTTAYDEFAIKAFKYSAVDYLLKPIDMDELSHAVKTAEVNTKKNNSVDSSKIEELLCSIQEINKATKIAIPSINEILFINEDDIVRCEGENNYTHIFLISGKKITSTKTLKLIENKLDQGVFYRIHNSSIININYIDKINKEGKVTLVDKTILEISRRKKKSFLEFINKF